MGFVPKEEVEGRARFVFLSWRGGAEFFKPWTLLTRLDLSRAFRGLGPKARLVQAQRLNQ
jgi:hypothetical protein